MIMWNVLRQLIPCECENVKFGDCFVDTGTIKPLKKAPVVDNSLQGYIKTVFVKHVLIGLRSVHAVCIRNVISPAYCLD